MIDRETAVSLASAFLRENADGAEPLSVRAEDDGGIISDAGFAAIKALLEA